jgi:hypothetical protein
MKANELRIGNLVVINNEKHHPKMKAIPLIVCGIEKIRSDESAKILLNYPKEQENIIIPAFSQFEEFVNPIELTGQFMIFFGFKETFMGTYSIWDFEDFGRLFDVTQDSNGFTFQIHGDFIEIKYVHELQNIHFIITGEELAIA